MREQQAIVVEDRVANVWPLSAERVNQIPEPSQIAPDCPKGDPAEKASTSFPFTATEVSGWVVWFEFTVSVPLTWMFVMAGFALSLKCSGVKLRPPLLQSHWDRWQVRNRYDCLPPGSRSNFASNNDQQPSGRPSPASGLAKPSATSATKPRKKRGGTFRFHPRQLVSNDRIRNYGVWIKALSNVPEVFVTRYPRLPFGTAAAGSVTRRTLSTVSLKLAPS